MFRFKRRGSSEPNDRYLTLAPLGEGGDAVITKALDGALYRIVAVKELKASEHAPTHSRRTFQREARLVCFLDHPGVVPIFDHFVTTDDAPCYAMKLIDGDTLGERVGYRPGKGGTRLPVAEAVGLVTRVIETLAYAHDRGVAHLDLKPENIMIGRYGEVLLMDWGNARLFDETPYRQYLGEHAKDEDVAVLVDEPPDLLSGTPHFMSPEQTCNPRDRLTAASDIFSVGTLLYLLLTGELPFRGKDVHALLAAIRDDEPKPLRQLNAEVPQRLAEITNRLLAKTPGDRYPSLRDLLEDLRSYQDAGQGFPVQTLELGEVLFREGDEGHGAYVVVDGNIAITKSTPEGEIHLADLGPGEIFGELAILTSQPRTATATAAAPTTLRRMDGAEVEAELEKIPPWVAGMVQTLANRFIQVNDELASRRDAE